MKKKRCMIFCIAAVCLGAIAFWRILIRDAPIASIPVGYILCGDDDLQARKVYRVDLLKGVVASVSDPIDWMGSPAQLSIDPNRLRLYVSSFRGTANDYYPMTVVSFEGGAFETVTRFTTNPEDVEPRDSTQLNTKPSEVYMTVVSPDGNELYVMHGGMPEGKLRAVWNADTGEVLRDLESYIRPKDVWSPDGRLAAGVWPTQERNIKNNGVPTIEKVRAGVDVRDVQTGKRISLTYLEDGKGLHPPWGRLEGPLIRVGANSGEVRAYDRDTGDIISEFNIKELTGLRMGESGTWVEPDVLDDKQTIVLDMVCYSPVDEKVKLNCDFSTWDDWRIPKLKRSYVVVVDVLQQNEASRTEVGMHCTNPVVAYE